GLAFARSPVEAHRSGRDRCRRRQRRGARRPRRRVGESLAADGAGGRVRRRLRRGRAAAVARGRRTLLMYARWVVTALLVWPVLAAAVVLFVPTRLAKYVALGASLVELAISVPLWWTFQPATGMQFIVTHHWIPAWGIQYMVGVDGISLFMVLLTTFLMPLSVLGSWSYITKREPGFHALLLVLTTGMIGVFVALDLFLFYVMWEVMLIPMYFIIGVWGGENRLYAAIKFFIYTMFGSLLMLVAILVLYFHVGQATGTYSFGYTHLLTNVGGLGSLAWWLFGAFFLAFAIKVPMFPFHTWLP